MSKYALISVSDKTGVETFAQGLADAGYSIISTGGTAKALKAAGIKVQEISDFTGFPEMLDGRVKTLHPLVHGAILKLRDNPEHIKTAETHKIGDIDIVAVNLYPFEAVASKAHSSFEEIIENIDIGGPAMVRSAAKNNKFVTIVVHASDYERVLAEVRTGGTTTAATRLELAAKAYSHTSMYDSMIAGYLNRKLGVKFPQEFTFGGRLKQAMRYGENPHQDAAFYQVPLSGSFGVANAEQLHGKELSYNNVVDILAAVELTRELAHFDGRKRNAAVIIKHTNPCGAATATTLEQAYDDALACDPLSAFGGIVAFSGAVDDALAQKLNDIFLEVIIAPDFTEGALALLTKKKNVRLMKTPLDKKPNNIASAILWTGDSFLLQDADSHSFASFEGLVVPTKRKPSKDELASLEFAWVVAKYVKSNAIVYVSGTRTIGIGAGQMSRVDSSKIASIKATNAKLSLKGCVMASDAFFPFRDSVDEAAAQGIAAIVSPGGSVRDSEVIQAADEANIAMVFTDIRHFRH
ncbi:bifunctional phosphoribosylaminoimidazolecarboxamide formyltransferase/IMP cyclohydrolase [Deferribacterales bacterium RsTz2092]|nr:bifunctional purine biosynthesis protein PurH [Deferribacterales bacterium]